VGFYMIHNSLQTQATELAPMNRGSAVAAHAFFVFLGQACGPILYGVGLTSIGNTAVVVIAGVAMALLGIATGWGLKTRSVLPLAAVSERA
jgi:predicted MFS family arabinose efflux permease